MQVGRRELETLRAWPLRPSPGRSRPPSTPRLPRLSKPPAPWASRLAAIARFAGSSRGRAWLPSLAGLIIIGVTILMEEKDAVAYLRPGIVAAALVAERWVALRLSRPLLWIGLDAAASTALVLTTGEWFSPFYFLLAAGIWWSAHLGVRRAGVMYAMGFSLVYLAVAGGISVGMERLQEALEDVVAAIGLGLGADLLVRLDRRAIAVSEALRLERFGRRPSHDLHGRLQDALREVVLPVDSLLAGAQVGLRVRETELLGLLVLGLTNQQIADTLSVSEATVKLRLTELYRRLGIKGRAAAIARAHDLAIGGEAPPSPAPGGAEPIRP